MAPRDNNNLPSYCADLVARLPDPVFLFEPSGRCADCNPAAATFFGDVPAIPPPDLAAFAERLHGVMCNELAFTLTPAALVEAWRSGDDRVFEMADGKRLRIIAVTHDDGGLAICLARSVDSAEARQKGVFLAMIGHELRTPLTSLIGLQACLLKDTQLLPVSRRQIEQAQSSAEALLNLINDILDAARLESGKFGLETLDFSLEDVLSEVFPMLEHRSDQKGLYLNCEVDPDVPQFLRGDPTRLRQVLVNLVGNAIKFTDSGGVRVSVKRLDTGDTKAHLRFAVADTGVGIPPDAVQRLFQSFEQADSSTTRKYGGSGLGLAICKQLVALMGGQIGVESTLGAGSVFWFELHLPFGAAPPEEVVALAPHTHQLNILCAEDFPANQLILRTLLEDMGHRLRMVSNGLEAVTALASESFDLVLMDGRMPYMDGLEASRLIRAGGGSDTPVLCPDVHIIAVTANASDEERAAYREAGVNAVLGKPIDEKALHLALAGVIEARLAAGAHLEPRILASLSDLDAMFGFDTPDAAPGDSIKNRADSRRLRYRELHARMREAFARDIAVRLKEINAALSERNCDAASRLFHGLKGSAAYLYPGGHLHLLCAELEVAADRGQWEDIEDAMPWLVELMQHPEN